MWDEGTISQKRSDPGLQWASYNQGKSQLCVLIPTAVRNTNLPFCKTMQENHLLANKGN